MPIRPPSTAFLAPIGTPIRILLGCVLALAVLAGLFLLACNHSPAPNSPVKPHSTLLADQPQAVNSLSPVRSVSIGRESAIFAYLAKNWQITQINGIPIANTAILDLQEIEQGFGQLSLGEHCSPILVQFDVSKLGQSIISTKEIEREIDDCSDSFEDRLMATLADLNYIEKRPTDTNDVLILSGYQDKITLVPVR